MRVRGNPYDKNVVSSISGVATLETFFIGVVSFFENAVVITLTPS